MTVFKPLVTGVATSLHPHSAATTPTENILKSLLNFFMFSGTTHVICIHHVYLGGNFWRTVVATCMVAWFHISNTQRELVQWASRDGIVLLSVSTCCHTHRLFVLFFPTKVLVMALTALHERVWQEKIAGVLTNVPWSRHSQLIWGGHSGSAVTRPLFHRWWKKQTYRRWRISWKNEHIQCRHIHVESLKCVLTALAQSKITRHGRHKGIRV